MRDKISVAAAVLLIAGRAHGAGFHIDEQDARATGRAGAVTANPRNASAIYYNPGAVGDLKGFHLDIGAALVGPSADFTPPGARVATTDMVNNVVVLPQAYATYRITDLLAVGLGLNAPFGLKVEWHGDSPGRAIVREVQLRTFFITPTVALNLSQWVPGLSIGAGLDLVPSSVRLDRDILFGVDVGTLAFSGTAFGVGGRGGIYYRPKGLDCLAFGATYRSPVKLNFSGDANFSASPIFRSSLPPDGETKTSVTLPQTLDFGVALDLLREWELELDVNWTGWTSFKSLTLEFPGQTVVSERNWHDTTTIRVGTEVLVAPAWEVRGGFAWDRTPIPDTTLDFLLPDANRIILTGGVGWGISSLFRADFGALYIPPAQQTTSFADPYQPPIKGTFQVEAWVVQLSVGVKLDPAAKSAEPPTTTN